MLVGIDSPDKVKQTGKATNFAWFAIHPFVRKVLNVNWLTEVLPSFIRSKPVADRRHPKMISQLNFYAARQDYRFIKAVVQPLAEFGLHQAQGQLLFVVC